MILELMSTMIICSFFGVFAFMGLIFPHLLRFHPYFRHHLIHELLVGPLLAGLIFVILDWACSHWTFYGAEIPVGMLTGLVGSLFFILLILKRHPRLT